MNETRNTKIGNLFWFLHICISKTDYIYLLGKTSPYYIWAKTARDLLVAIGTVGTFVAIGTLLPLLPLELSCHRNFCWHRNFCCHWNFYCHWNISTPIRTLWIWDELALVLLTRQLLDFIIDSKGMSMPLLKKFNHQIYRSDLSMPFKVMKFLPIKFTSTFYG